jgi:outer membrane murein-binding lipoprotein Lpp
MKTTLSVFALAAGLAVLAGCSTPQSRINDNPAVYARLTPEQQQLIKDGKVAIGFDMAMVKLALGDPDRIRERTDANGTSETWSYVTYEGDDGLLLYTGYYHRYYYGLGDPFYPYYLAYPTRREHTHFRVVFREGKVVLIENEKR